MDSFFFLIMTENMGAGSRLEGRGKEGGNGEDNLGWDM